MFDEVRQWVISSSLDIIAISETWLHSDIPDCIVQIPGYQIFRSDRSGGVALFIRDQFNVLRECILANQNVLVNSYRSCSDIGNYLQIGVFYRTP
ncbi:hypothetical protein GJ496_005206 [Pomphorhynchus laevis]|nr:hypothetical protein GJ496_005206 [Pomphorhynchus laevis]